MRADMSKVLVEEPRSGRAFARAIAGSRRQLRQRPDRDGESAPARFGMKAGYRSKWFGEHLGPLYRWLRGQVDRPWDKVYSELCATLDRRSVVQAHLFEHIGDEVALETVWQDGQVWTRGWRQLEPLSENRAALYVHPRTGILLENRARTIARRERRQARVTQAQARAQERRIGAPLPADVQWHRLDGLWYEVRLLPLDHDGAGVPVFDVVLKRVVDARHQSLLGERYDRVGVYAAAKRQLDRKTLRRHGLEAA